MIHSAQNYQRIVESDFTDVVALRSLRALRRVEYDEWIPPMLAFLNWVRRLGRSARLTVYFQLISAIKSGKNADEIREVFRKAAQNAEFMHLIWRCCCA
jgi:hypothetical protein